MTVFGALYNGHVLYELARSTNKKDLIKFIKKLANSLGHQVTSSVLVLDNHRAHWSNDLADCCLGVGLNLLYLPPYASELNPIELVWAHFKRVWG